ncbi:hypothetical protein E2562_035350 [Oryza meyeriana var. granulata]|uniref:Uncharacterized protein n=1 Tax=Oryza meyeriana var. granulata TaxID=110450 RepID=A0A6G1CVM4_9ORYZ|nr:hypothetical protein E2562_035350 [Oryza meyeriana var. granulata]
MCGGEASPDNAHRGEASPVNALEGDGGPSDVPEEGAADLVDAPERKTGPDGEALEEAAVPVEWAGWTVVEPGAEPAIGSCW